MLIFFCHFNTHQHDKDNLKFERNTCLCISVAESRIPLKSVLGGVRIIVALSISYHEQT